MCDGCRKEILGGTSKLILGEVFVRARAGRPRCLKEGREPRLLTDEGGSTGYPKTDVLDAENDPTGCQAVSNG